MGLTDFFFPRLCVGCNRVGSYLCLNCQKEILQKDLICPLCKRAALGGATHPVCKKQYGLDGLWSLGSYEGHLKTTIQKLKYRWVSDAAVGLVEIMIHYWVLYSAQFLDEIKKDKGVGWVIVPVPLHPKRKRWRGFNQSELLAHLLAQKIGLQYEHSLVRTKYTQPQVGLEASQRRENIKDAFAISPKLRLTGINYLLIDDVWTTGSTMKECCAILKKAGAKKVWAITLAR